MEGDDNTGLIDVDSKMSANLKASNPITSGQEDCGRMDDYEEMEIDSSVSVLKEKLSLYNKDKDMLVFQTFGLWRLNGCIYKVPSKLRELNEDSYSPRVVSIGPLHYGKPQLQAMEPYKWMCLNRFLNRTNSISIRQVVIEGEHFEKYFRTYYQDKFNNISRQELSVMIMLDGIFIMELLMEKWLESSTGCSALSRLTTEKIFANPWMENDVRHDMMLLENQLPYMVLSHLFHHEYSKVVKCPLHRLIGLYFDNVGINSAVLPNHEDYHHMVDLLRKCNVQEARVTILSEFSSLRGKLEHIRSATELQETGVTFKNEIETCLLHIQFTPRGLLTIPHLKVDEWTETFFRNMVAFEQGGRHEDQPIASYIILMSSILRTPNDVDLLVSHGIIENVHNSNVSSLFSNLRKEIVVDSETFFYTFLCDKLNTYSKDRWHQLKGSWLRWKRMLRRDYFSNPWSIISVIAAFILLSLTILQSVCSVISIM